MVRWSDYQQKYSIYSVQTQHFILCVSCKDQGKNKIDIKTPCLNGNNSQFGANEVNLILPWILTLWLNKKTVNYK